MRIVAAIRGDLGAYLKGEQDALAKRITEITNRESLRLRDELRAQVRAARLGPGLEKAWRHETYPRSRRASLRPAGLVYSKSTVLHGAFDEGPVIHAGHSFLVIPTREAAAMGFAETREARGSRAIPAGARRRYGRLGAAVARLGAKNIKFLPTKAGNVLVVYTPPKRGAKGPGGRNFTAGPERGFQLRGGRGDVPLFVLVRQVRVRKVLDIDRAAKAAEQRFYAALAALG